MGYTLHQGEAGSILEKIKMVRVDVVITDPPYGIDGSSGTINKKRGRGNYNSFSDTPAYLREVIVPIIEYCISAYKTVILTPGNKNFMLYPQPDSFGSFYQPAAVGLQTFGNLDSQPIFYYGKNATKKNMGVPCSFKMTSRADDVDHPCRKPTREWERLILSHTLPGQTILDPFMGSGVTGEICVKNGRNFIGIELGCDYFKLAETRIKNANNEFTPTAKEQASGQMSIFGGAS